MKKSHMCVIPLSALLLGAGWMWWGKNATVVRAQKAKGAVEGESEKEHREIDNSQIQVIEGSAFTEDYGGEEGGGMHDLEVLMLVIQDCQIVVKNFDEYFLPDNKAIVAFLQGGNRDKLAWIPPGHSFVNEDGELVDRWRNPVFFHRESGLKFSLRSSGPDGRMWTDDDLVKE